MLVNTYEVSLHSGTGVISGSNYSPPLWYLTYSYIYSILCSMKLNKINTLEIKPNGKYLLIFDRDDAGTDRELTKLNEALKKLFGKAKVLAIFSKNLSDIKIAELLEEDGKTN